MAYIDPQQPAPLYDVMQNHKAEILASLRVCLPATVSAINADGTINAIPAVMQTTTQAGNVLGKSTIYPEFSNCPVVTTQGGGVGVVMPIAVGDGCLLIFSDRCLDAWKINGTPAPLPSFRMHDLSDGFPIVGINSLAKPIIPSLDVDIGEGGICEVNNPTGALVAVNVLTHKVTIANGTQDLATILGTLVTTLATLNTAIASMTTASIASGVPQGVASGLETVLVTVLADLAALLY